METVRLRLVFDNILSKLQNTQGLKRCWVLLKPQHQTISDLSSYILNVFNLQNHCPHGLLLSMEGFALPDFESTSILKDNDILRVEKNCGWSSDVVTLGNDMNALEVEFVDAQPVASTGMNLLANEEFEKGAGGYQSEEEDDVSNQKDKNVHVENEHGVKTVSKKRKATKELKSSKKKKTKSATAEKHATVVEDVENNVSRMQNEALITPKLKGKSESSEASSKAKGLSQPQDNEDGNVDALPSTSGTKKLPSRSARRKKAKRKWLREKLRAERKEQQRQLRQKFSQQSSVMGSQQVFKDLNGQRNQDVSEKLLENGNAEHKEDNQEPDKDSDVEDNVVPVVIRPGHIRFEPLNKVGIDQPVRQPQIDLTRFQWNGTTNKKKGQKWGKEKATTSYKRNDYKNVNQERPKMQQSGARHVPDHLDFEKLEFYTTLPKEGDVIAYRLIELSSSWTPELTSYRVGKIQRYDVQSNRVRLVQVPGYPVIFEEKSDDASSALSETTPYARDGSLWIEFSSLIEVRLVKSVSGGTIEVSLGDQDNGTGFQSNNGNASHESAQENGKANAWEEINQALESKKAELAQEDKWNKAESSGKRWSYKALRGSALGPTMALLRAQNEL